MVSSSADGRTSGNGADDPPYLTSAGRQRLEDRLQADIEYRERLSPMTPGDVQDSGDEAARLEAADELAQIDERIAIARDILDRAIPVPDGPPDGVVRLGSTVELRDDTGERLTVTVVHPVELGEDEQAVSMNAPVGAALLGRHVGDQVHVSTPDGGRTFEILEVLAYQP